MCRRTNPLFRIVVALLLLTGLSAATAQETVVNIAVLAFRPAPEVQQRWQPLVEHMNEVIPGYKFQVTALGYRDLEAAIAKRSVDFVFTNPSHYMLMTFRNGLSSPLATLIPLGRGRALSKFGGVIITRSDRNDISSIQNLRGHTIAAVTKGSLGGYQAQAMELQENGIRIPQDVALVETGMPHDLVAKAVVSGKADAGFVRTSILENMSREGKIDLTKIKVINPKTADRFPLLLSTRLYPEWPFSAMPGADEDLARKITATLLSLPHDGDLSKQLKIHGFTIPTDYEVVRKTLEALRLPPFDRSPVFTAEDIWQKYSWEIVAGIGLISITLLLALWLVFLNRKLYEGREKIKQAAQEWHLLLTALGEGVYGIDNRGRCTFINPAALKMLGFSQEEVVGKDQHQLFHHHHKDGRDYPGSDCPIYITLQDGIARKQDDWFWRKDGSGFPVLLTTAPTGGARKDKGAVVIFRDISEQQKKEKELHKEATTDPLTGAANRRLFFERMGIELERYKRFGEPTSILMVDIDHFKKVNDEYGHAAGDEVLRHFAELTASTLRSTDLLGRYGGEEFGILLPVTDASAAYIFAERLRTALSSTPAKTEQGEIAFTVSIGITEFHPSDVSSEASLGRADAALYHAKESGRNRSEISCLNLSGESTHGDAQAFIKLIWHAGYACNESSIDKEHQELFELANSLLSKVGQSDIAKDEIAPYFIDLLDHVVKHFHHEIEILRNNGYPDVDEHEALHDQLIEQASTLQQQFENDQVSFGELVNFLVSEVVAGHMLKEDKKFHSLFENDRL